MIQFEKEIINYLNIPSIPAEKNEWDGKSSFKTGCAVVTMFGDSKAYAVCTYDAEINDKPRVIKAFGCEPFYDIEKIFVVPDFMNTDVENMDLDDESKEAAGKIIEEAAELTEEDENDEVKNELDALQEWVFPEITNKDEAIAWVRQYNSANGIKGRVPENEETLKLRLMNIYSTLKEKTDA